MTGTPICKKMTPAVKQTDKMNEQRKERQAVLHEKGLQLEAIVEAFDGLIYLCSQDYRVEFINEHYIKHIGYDATGQVCYKSLQNRDAICPWCLNDRIFKGETVRCEVLTPKDNWYYVVSTPIYHSDGSVSKLAMIMDISDRKQAEQSLKQKIEEQELLLDNIQTQIWYLANAKTYGAVNKAHAEFLNLEKKDIEYKSLYDILSKEESEVSIANNVKVFDEKVILCFYFFGTFLSLLKKATHEFILYDSAILWFYIKQLYLI